MSGLDRSRARWNVLAQQTLMAQLDRKPGPGQPFWTDGWDGYPAARRRLLDFLAPTQPANPLVIGGDVHSFWVTDLKPDFDDAASPVVATEFVGTSITSQFGRAGARGDAAGQPARALRRRPPSRLRAHGGDAAALAADLRAVRDGDPAPRRADTLATFVVEDGRPGRSGPEMADEFPF